MQTNRIILTRAMRTSSGELDFRSRFGFRSTTSAFSDFMRCDWMPGDIAHHSGCGFFPKLKMSDLLRFDWPINLPESSGWLVSDFLRFDWFVPFKLPSDLLLSDFLRFGWLGGIRNASDWLPSDSLLSDWLLRSNKVDSDWFSLINGLSSG